MKIDLWTKVVFTVIAIALSILAVRSLQVIPVQARGTAMENVVWKMDLVKIGGNYVFLNDLVKK